jgi:hypothetical protein
MVSMVDGDGVSMVDGDGLGLGRPKSVRQCRMSCRRCGDAACLALDVDAAAGQEPRGE